MTSEELDRYARDLVADWPPLTEHQRTRISSLLRPHKQSRPSTARRKKAA